MTRFDEELPLSRTKRVADDVRKELEFHLHERARELEAHGLSAEQAMAEARQQFGDQPSVEAACEAIETRRRGARRRSETFGALRQDVVVGVRVLRKSPGFTIAAVLMLALGIGANSAVFSIVNRVLLQPLPYENSQQIVTLVERHANGGWGNIPWSNFVDIQEQSRSFDALAEYSAETSTVLGTSTPLRVNASVVSADFFKVFSIRPFMGRLAAPQEHVAGGVPVAVVSYAFWRDHLGSPTSLEKAHIRMDQDYTVIGVAPEGFDYPEGNQVWTSLELSPPSVSRTAHNSDAVGRLKAGISPAASQREVETILARLSAQYSSDFDAVGATVSSLQESLTGSYKTPLYLLLGASGLVLLAACVNTASAMLARGTARSAEFSVRLALGATRARVVQQLVTESALLAVAGCLAGLGLATLLLRALTVLAPASLHIDSVHVDYWAQGFALAVAVFTTLIFGLFPAFRISSANMSLALREGSRGTSGTKRMRVWNLLVATEVALAVVLLSSSALLMKSFTNVMQNKLGFDADGVTTMRIELPRVNYAGDSPTIPAFHQRLLEQLQNQPGVTSVGFANFLPLAGSNTSGSLIVEGKPFAPGRSVNGYSVYRVVGGDYFAALNIPIVKGRTFRTGAASEASPVVVISEAFAREEYANVDPIGKRIKVAGMDRGEEPWYSIIGVAADVRGTSATSNFTPTYYFDHRTRPAYRTRSVSYVLRSALPTSAIAPMLRRAVSGVDEQVPLDIETMSDIVARSSAARRFPMLLIGAFAAVALVMAIVGIYAVVSYAVTQRTREIGVRLALGASPLMVRSLVLSSAMRGVVPGLLAGAALSFVTARLLVNLLYGVSPFDPVALGTALGLLGLAALLSTALPAIRATRVDPLIAMRAD